MKKILLSALFICLGAFVFGQETVVYDKNVEVRKVGSFKGVKVANGIRLYLKQGDSEAVAVSAATDEYRDKIKTVVENGILKIFIEETNWWRSVKTIGRNPKAYVTAKTLERIAASSGASVSIDGTLNANDLVINASSGSVLRGMIKAASVSVDGSSGSVITLSGSAEKTEVECSSGSIFHGYELAANNGETRASSGSIIELTINKEMSAKASSGSAIRYRGNGGLSSVSTSSGGTINKR